MYAEFQHRVLRLVAAGDELAAVGLGLRIRIILDKLNRGAGVTNGHGLASHLIDPKPVHSTLKVDRENSRLAQVGRGIQEVGHHRLNGKWPEHKACGPHIQLATVQRGRQPFLGRTRITLFHHRQTHGRGFGILVGGPPIHMRLRVSHELDNAKCYAVGRGKHQPFATRPVLDSRRERELAGSSAFFARAFHDDLCSLPVGGTIRRLAFTQNDLARCAAVLRPAGSDQQHQESDVSQGLSAVAPSPRPADQRHDGADHSDAQ